MSTFGKIGAITRLLANSSIGKVNNTCKLRSISTTPCQRDLMEFFDDEKNWGQQEVKSGRSWKSDELRLKSSTDLHKLWYVLLKERNMLLTMEEECKKETRLFPSPERLDKVEESMNNLENVVRERNVAYHMLETGEKGERPTKLETSVIGLHYRYKMIEHTIPQEYNKKWKEQHQSYKYDKEVEMFREKLNEKNYLAKKKQHRRDFNHVIKLLNRFPNMDMEALKQQYPNVDIEKAKNSRKYGGHFEPK